MSGPLRHPNIGPMHANEGAVAALAELRHLSLLEENSVQEIHDLMQQQYGLKFDGDTSQSGNWAADIGKPGYPTGVCLITKDSKAILLQIGWQGTYSIKTFTNEVADASLTPEQLDFIAGLLGSRGTPVERFEASYNKTSEAFNAWLKWIAKTNPAVARGAERYHQSLSQAKQERNEGSGNDKSIAQEQSGVRWFLGKMLGMFGGESKE
jgi:hypothetical protein